MQEIGIITPDITRSLGFISQEAGHLLSDSLGIITPDIMRSLGEVPPTEIIPLGAMRLDLGGHSTTTWATVLGLSALGAAAAAFAVSRSARGATYAAVGGVAGSAAGMALSQYMNIRKAKLAMSSGQGA